MTDLREQLADVIEVAIDNAHDMDVTHRDYANASADAIIEALQGMVQPLVWRETTSGTSKFPAWKAEGFFIVESLNMGGFHSGGLRYETLEDAKAAAQSHHVATIMQTLGVTNV